jgi:heme-degrading monooxygenase HmoA
VILEIADIRIQPGQQAAFEESIRRGVAAVVGRAKGFKSFSIHKGIESPERFILQIVWETLEDHTVGFRQGPLFPEWRTYIQPFFAAPPSVEHYTLVDQS